MNKIIGVTLVLSCLLVVISGLFILSKDALAWINLGGFHFTKNYWFAFEIAATVSAIFSGIIYRVE